MKKIFTLVASACLSVMLASAAAPTVGLTMDGDAGTGVTLLGTGAVSELVTPTALTVEAWVRCLKSLSNLSLSNCFDSGGMG